MSRPPRPNPNPRGISRYHANLTLQKEQRKQRKATHVKQETAAEARVRRRLEAEDRNRA